MEYSTLVSDTLVKERKRPQKPAPERRETARLRRRTRVRANGALRAAVSWIVLVTVLAVAAPLLSPHAHVTVDFAQANMRPSSAHPFGTDDLGRDVLYRVLLGGRVTLAAGLGAALIAVLLGAVLGTLAGFYGGWIDMLTMRLTDLALSIPAFFIVLLLASVLAPGIITICVVIGATQWMETARVSRAAVVSIKPNEYVDAARALGASDGRVLLHHVLRQAVGPVAVSAAVAVSQAIMTESAMSFLGFGVQPPGASWGILLQGAQATLGTAPWRAVYPGAMIFLTVLSFYTIGDVLHARAAVRNTR
jgi:peptide/nickel transport system permease protein